MKISKVYVTRYLHKKIVKYHIMSATSKYSNLSGLLTSSLSTIEEFIVNFCFKTYSKDR